MSENDCERRKLEDLLKLTHESLANENYGVKKITTLTRFGFDPINCTPGDVMHILLEGIARKLVMIFLDLWINVKRTDIREINLRLDIFVYGYSDEKNKVKYFQSSDMKKKELVISASQMMTLIMLFPFIFYDILDISSKEYE